jgi:hypothetical protein
LTRFGNRQVIPNRQAIILEQDNGVKDCKRKRLIDSAVIIKNRDYIALNLHVLRIV